MNLPTTLKEYCLPLEEANQLVDKYIACISSAFDALTEVQDAAMDLTDKIISGKIFPFGTRHYTGFNNVLHMMSPYTKMLPAYLKQRKKGLIKDDIPQEIIYEMEMIASEAQDWRVMFNAAVKQYKETWNDYRMLSKMKGWV